MSEYKTINKPGWWEQEYTEVRLEVVAVAKEVVFYFERNFQGKETPRNMPLQYLPQAKHLPECTGWDWQPEPKVEEIEFPDWILPGWDFVTRDRNGVWVYQSTPQLDLQSGCWTFGDSHFSQKLNRAIDCSWVPDTDDWTKAVWQRKPKQDDEWIEWKGGLRPIIELISVDVKLRSGKTDSGSGYWRWLHTGKDDDIVAYRVIK